MKKNFPDSTENLDEQRDELTTRGKNRRKKVLETAARLFQEHGYAGVSINEVVRQSGGSLTTTYKIFGSKDGLFLAVFEKVMRRVEQKIRSFTPRHLPIQENLTYLVKECFSYQPENLLRLFMFDGIDIPVFKERVLSVLASSLQKPIEDWLEQAAKMAGASFRIPMSDVALIFVRVLRGTIVEVAIDPGFDKKRREQAIQLVTVVLSSLLK